MAKKVRFDPVCLEYISRSLHFQQLQERIGEIYSEIISECSQAVRKKIKKSERSAKGYMFLEGSFDEQINEIKLVRKNDTSSYIACLSYGFTHVDDLMYWDKLNHAAEYFAIWIDIGRKANGLKNERELKTFWNQKYRRYLEECNFRMPALPKNESPYAYYGVYDIKRNGIVQVGKVRKIMDYTEVVTEAFVDEFTGSSLKDYCNLRKDINEWRKEGLAS